MAQEGRCVLTLCLVLLAIVGAGQRQGEALGVAPAQLLNIQRRRIGKRQPVGIEDAIEMPDPAREGGAERPIGDDQRL
jgi:hypothetical protein